MEKEERDLIKKAQEGKHWAFEQLIRKYDKRVLTLAYQLVGNTSDAEDVYQEVFLKIYRKISRFRFQSDFYTWLYRIVVNCAITYRKRRNRNLHKSLDEPVGQMDGWQWTPADDAPGPDELISHVELSQKINDSLDALSLMQRTVFVLRFYQDFKIKDIAHIIGCTEGTVKNTLFRSIKKVKKELKTYIQS